MSSNGPTSLLSLIFEFVLQRASTLLPESALEFMSFKYGSFFFSLTKISGAPSANVPTSLNDTALNLFVELKFRIEVAVKYIELPNLSFRATLV